MMMKEETMESIDRLREYAETKCGWGVSPEVARRIKDFADAIEHETCASNDIRRFAERLEAAAAEQADVTLFGVDYTALPVDTEGNPIHIGDVMEWSDGETFEVVGIGDTGTLYYLETRDDGTVGVEWTSTECKRHHATTVEDLLSEYALKCEEAGNSGPEVKRLATEYAMRLMLAGEDA